VTIEQWFAFVKEAGAYISPLLLGAIVWLDSDRKRLIAENKLKDERLVSLSERFITVATELKTFLFNERKA
jgi:hypothetical protein